MNAVAELPSTEEVDLNEIESLLEQSGQAYRNFVPRPDQPDKFDQQHGFCNSKTRGVKFLVGGNGAGTTECVMHSIAKFVLRDQPPPRHDTPFWVIAGTYEQVMEACWKEKLLGHGHIPGAEVDWDRISWYKPDNGWPFRVPLKPWPGRKGKNWVLEFKSYEQGRSNLQARSIGGFAFIEQFPWGLLTEVNRGCREYNFPGAKMCEFTPIDPALSTEFDKMVEDDKFPPGWEIYRANTQCAVDAGHVNRQWFEEFFASVPDEMRETRMTGAAATYEGCIFQGFMAHRHLVGDDVMFPGGEFPSGVQHRRSIDWGFGPENAFACEFAYRNGIGEWFIYDEYYSTDQTYTVLDHLAHIGDMREWPVNHPQYGCTWADPSSPDNMRIAARNGWNIQPARNAVFEGIDCVRALLKPQLGTGKPRIYIHKENCPNLARQFRTYRWKKGSAGVNPQDASREPLKKDDHAIDAARYLLFSESDMGLLIPSTASSREAYADQDRHGVHAPRGRRGV